MLAPRACAVCRAATLAKDLADGAARDDRGAPAAAPSSAGGEGLTIAGAAGTIAAETAAHDLATMLRGHTEAL